MWLNRRQRIVILAGLGAIVLMGAFPPWVYTFLGDGGGFSEESAGYHFVASPPGKQKPYPAFGVRLDVARLLVQWAIVAAITGIGLLFPSKPRDDQTKSQGLAPMT
jgi:hypothetical protein